MSQYVDHMTYGSFFLEGEHLLPYLATDIFKYMLCPEKEKNLWSESRLPTETTPVVTSTFIIDCDRVMRKYLASTSYNGKEMIKVPPHKDVKGPIDLTSFQLEPIYA